MEKALPLDFTNPQIQSLLNLALSEDIGSGDITTEATLAGSNPPAKARIIAKQPLVVCGQELAATIFHKLDPKSLVRAVIADGGRAECGATVCEIEGALAAILTGERTALNFMQRLSGISTKTSAIVSSLPSGAAVILDTRKTTPGWRLLEKYAVRIGGGRNHRIGLFDAFLIKNNHVDALGGDITEAIRRCRRFQTGINPVPLLQVEVRNQQELEAAVAQRPDAILLDNFNVEELKAATTYIRSQPGGTEMFLEASGGINELSAPGYSTTGVNALSMGALTHSAIAVDLALRIDREK